MGTHPIFESDFDCLTDMWVETLPTVGVWLGTFYLGYMGKMYTDEAGTHKGAFSGGLWWWPLNWSNSGTKKPPCGAFQGFEYTVEIHQYGRDRTDGSQQCIRIPG